MCEISSKVVEICKKKNYIISTCESFTGGLIASNITDIPGSSEVLYGSFITYMLSSKIELLKINREIIDKFGVVSSEVACEMAFKIKNILNTDIAISSTGYAGPDDGSENGHFFIGIAVDNKIYSFEERVKLDRIGVKVRGAKLALKHLLDVIEK